jgi:hypothetical protein
MSLAYGFTAVQVLRPGRRVALICLVVAAVSVVTSFALGSPLSRALSPSSEIDWLPFAGGVLPLLAMGASALGLFGGKMDRTAAAMPEIERLVRQLNETLSGQRDEVARLQRSCESATQDAAAASARVARVADAAIDAETRLASGIAQWERKWEEHLAAATPYGGASGTTEDSLAARVVQRMEGVMPDFADIIRTKFSAFPDPSFHIAAGRLNATVEAAMVTFKGVIDDAAHKMTSLNEISQSLRRDAVALDLAGREIATAGATVVARAGEAISGVDAALASLPAAVSSMNGTAAEMKTSLEEATLAMRANRTALMTAGDQAAQSAGRLLAAGSAIDAQREAAEAAARRITEAVAEVVARVDAAQADRTTLTDLIARLHEVADVLTVGTGTLTQAGKDAAGGVDATLAAIRSATGEMIEQIRGALAPLPSVTADLTSNIRTDVAANVASDISNRIAEQIEATIGKLTAAVQITPGIIAQVSADIATRVGGQLEAAVETLTEAARIAPDVVATVSTGIATRVGDQMETAIGALTDAARITPDMIATVSADVAARIAEHVDTAIGSLADASRITPETYAGVAATIAERLAGQIDAAIGAMTHAAQLPPDLAQTLSTAVAERVAPQLALAAEALATAETRLAAASDGLAAQTTGAASLSSLLADAELEIRLTEVLAPLTEAAQSSARTLTEATDALAARTAETMAQVPATLAAAGDALVARAAEAMAELPAAVQTMTDAAAMLSGESAAREASGRESLQPIAAALEAVAATLAERAERLDQAGQHIAAAGESVIERLADNASLGEAAMQALPAIAGEVDAITANLRTVAETLAAASATAPLDMDRLEWLSQRFEVTAAGLPVSIEARVSAAIPGDLPDAVIRLDAIGARLANLADTLPAELAIQVHTAIPDALSDATMRLEAAAPRFEQVSARLETAAGDLPQTANRLEALLPRLDQLDLASARLEAVADRMPTEIAEILCQGIPTGMPEAAAALEASGPALASVTQRLETLTDRLPGDVADRIPATLAGAADKLDAVGARLETALAQMPDQDTQNTTLATLTLLTGDIGKSVRRVEAALSEHDGALSSLIGSMSRVQAATAEVQAARTGQSLDNETSLGAALTHLDNVTDQTELLLRRTEALAEAVMAGRAPALSSVLTDRAPALLVQVEAAARRLRSTATALAIASDGPVDAQSVPA